MLKKCRNIVLSIILVAICCFSSIPAYAAKTKGPRNDMILEKQNSFSGSASLTAHRSASFTVYSSGSSFSGYINVMVSNMKPGQYVYIVIHRPNADESANPSGSGAIEGGASFYYDENQRFVILNAVSGYYTVDVYTSTTTSDWFNVIVVLGS